MSAPRTYKPPARERHFSEGYGAAMITLGQLLLHLIDEGVSDAGIVEEIRAVTELRLSLDSPNPVELLTAEI